jgi:LPXTG-motif cell wall-anchored protein
MVDAMRPVSKRLTAVAVLALVGATLFAAPARAQTPSADMRIDEITAIPSNPTPGSSVIWVIRYGDGPGGDNATGVEMRILVPTGMTYTSFAGAATTCTPNFNIVTCQLPDQVAGGHDIPLDIFVNVDPSASGNLTLTADVRAKEPDPDLSNNILSKTITVDTTTAPGATTTAPGATTTAPGATTTTRPSATTTTRPGATTAPPPSGTGGTGGSGSPELPETGGGGSTTPLLAAIVIAAGTGLLLVTRRRTPIDG